MSDLLKSLLVVIPTAAALVGLASWLLFRYLRRRIDEVFSDREKVLDSKLRRAEEYDEQMLVLSRQVLTEIDEVIYRSINLVREIVQAPDPRHVERLIGYWNQLSDHLFKYQLFIPGKTFDLVHKYKALLQNLALRLGASIQSGAEKEGLTPPPLDISEEDLDALRGQLPALDALYGEIVSHLTKIKDEGLGPSILTD